MTLQSCRAHNVSWFGYQVRPFCKPAPDGRKSATGPRGCLSGEKELTRLVGCPFLVPTNFLLYIVPHCSFWVLVHRRSSYTTASAPRCVLRNVNVIKKIRKMSFWYYPGSWTPWYVGHTTGSGIHYPGYGPFPGNEAPGFVCENINPQME